MSDTAMRPTATVGRPAVMAIALVILVFAIGYRIPIPGLDLVALLPQLQGMGNSGAMARVSILALGVMPLFSVISLVELLCLVVPQLARWRAGRGAWPMRVIVTALALVLACLQGLGVADALAQTGLVRADAVAGFAVVAVSCFVGATAVLAWLAWSIRLPGVGSGFWLLLAVPFIVALPAEISSWFAFLRDGAASPLHVAIVVAYVVATVAAVLFLHRALTAHVGDDDFGDMTVPASLLIWPPLLAGMVAGFGIAVLVTLPGVHMSLAPVLQPASLALTAMLVPLLLWIHARRLVPERTRQAMTPVLTLVACVQIAVLVLGEVMQTVLPLPFGLSGTMLVVATLVLASPIMRGSVSTRAA